MFIRLFEKMLVMLEDVASTYEKDAKTVIARKQSIHEGITEMLDLYAAELHQDNYAPAMQATLRARSRRKREMELAKKREQASALAKVEKFGQDPEPAPVQTN